MARNTIRKLKRAVQRCITDGIPYHTNIKHETLEYAKEFVNNKKSYYEQYRESCGCKFCGAKENLTFHHRDKEDKVLSIVEMAGTRQHFTIEDLKREIRKCDVLCEPCHIKLHFPNIYD